MPSYLIASPSQPRFGVRVGESTLEHAESVLAQLRDEPTVPSDLSMTEEGAPPTAERSWWRRMLRG